MDVDDQSKSLAAVDPANAFRPPPTNNSIRCPDPEFLSAELEYRLLAAYDEPTRDQFFSTAVRSLRVG